MIHFTRDPDFYAMGLSYQDRDRFEGDLHVLCPGWAEPGVHCSRSCHTEEGEQIYGPSRQRSRAATQAAHPTHPEPTAD